jgi:histidinol phosphatase-like enzyme (inositol monophosphatase family)
MDPAQHRLEVAIDAVETGGRAAMRWFRGRFDLEFKADGSPVTNADREAETVMVDLLAAAFPDDGILGEEGAERFSRSRWTWTIDPIDGTDSFVRGVPLFGTMAGLTDSDGEPVLGAVYLPALGELVYARAGHGCMWNGQMARVSPVRRLTESCLSTTGDAGFRRTRTEEHWRILADQAGMVRGWGDCYGHLLVATGRIEIMVDPVLEAWDRIPLVPIVTEAGGEILDWPGRPPGSSLVSTTPEVAAEIRTLRVAARSTPAG